MRGRCCFNIVKSRSWWYKCHSKITPVTWNEGQKQFENKLIFLFTPLASVIVFVPAADDDNVYLLENSTGGDVLNTFILSIKH